MIFQTGVLFGSPDSMKAVALGLSKYFHIYLIDGGYGPWTTSACSKTCGGGTQTKTRRCNSPTPAHGGKDCSRLGPASQQQACNANHCPGK